MSKSTRKFAECWDRFWFGEQDLLPAALVRISLGALLTVFYIITLANWNRFYARDGIASWIDSEAAYYPDWWCVFNLTDSFLPGEVWGLLAVAASLGFMLGWRTRICTIVLFTIQVSMIHRNLMMVNGEDLVFRMLLLYSLFAPLDRRLSLDARRYASGKSKPRFKPQYWALRMMQINMLAIYFFSVPGKLYADEAWWNGDALYLSLTNSNWSKFPYPELFYHKAVTTFFTLGTIAVESLISILVWVEPLRPFVLYPLMLMHLGIALCLKNTVFFTLSMICGLMIFVGRREAELLRQRLNRFG